MAPASVSTVHLHIRGVVQGVGFRPHVYSIAKRLDLAGWVRNSSDGVYCLVQGPCEAIDRFVAAVRAEAPPMAVIDEIVAEEVESKPLVGFEIRESATVAGAMTLVSPDIATCDACLCELHDERDRRHRYPFINCTNCGPRFTIIDDIPYDRPATTMRSFAMCPQCAAEYADPADRRFHAQPDACFVCGPRLHLEAPEAPADWRWPGAAGAGATHPHPHRDNTNERGRSDAIIGAAAAALAAGSIVALKGLGGFHLACDATDEAAVSRLRERKHRWGKPLAVMVHDMATAREIAEISDAEESLLASPVRPIVLLRRRMTAGDSTPALASSVAGDLPDLGIMLPYTPLHHLLLAAVDRPLVMTSGNVTDEPIATGNDEALSRLASIADAFLLHDREIRSRYDDSVVRVVAGRTQPLRRARGYAPHPLPTPFESDVTILAVGPEQKNTFTLLTGAHAFVSQHIGDMENAAALEHFHDTLDLYKRLFKIEPALVAHDLHPEYLTTKFALTLDLPRVGVQHHHAHIAGVAAEHGIAEPVIGVALDGTGYGADGHIWGGELLVATWEEFTRVGHLREVPMPGGAAAIRRPARMALGTLLGLDPALLGHPGTEPLLSRLREDEEAVVRRMVERSVNSPPTSSMGRLFDTVAALAGVRDDAAYEGEAAVELEAALDPNAESSYAFDLIGGDTLIADPLPVIAAVLDDVAAGTSPGAISARFHRAVVACIVSLATEAARRTGIRHVALSGGVFLNRFVLEGAMRELERAGLDPITHEKLPVNDGSVSYGQAAVAWARRHTV